MQRLLCCGLLCLGLSSSLLADWRQLPSLVEALIRSITVR